MIGKPQKWNKMFKFASLILYKKAIASKISHYCRELLLFTPFECSIGIFIKTYVFFAYSNFSQCVLQNVLYKCYIIQSLAVYYYKSVQCFKRFINSIWHVWNSNMSKQGEPLYNNRLDFCEGDVESSVHIYLLRFHQRKVKNRQRFKNCMSFSQ